jgi:hypothetical protein
MRNKVSRYVNRVRRFINQVPFTGEDVSTESHAMGSPTSTLSDDFIIRQLVSGARAITASVKACYVPDLIIRETSLVPQEPIIRLLPGRFRVTGVRAVRRSEDLARRLEETGQRGTAAEPAYSYENGEIRIYPIGLPVLYHYVTFPSDLTIDEDMPIPDVFESALVHYAAAGCFQRLQRLDRMAFAMEVYEDEIAPFRLEVRHGITEDAEVSVE